MCAVTSASLCWTLLSVCILFVAADSISITAESGQTVTLLCRAQSNKPIDTVTWSRSDITDENVLKYHGQQLLLSYQHPSFKNRVDLQDRQMKDGDVSLILKDVTINDAGTYECRVIQRGINQEKLISSITLSVVDPPGQEGVPVGVIIGASAGAAAVLALIGGGIWMLS
ncbi:programmed cell death 1 ligand 1-like [Oreochromis niloticus]|uniref:programmed cell death 1 ligand 1-like n=1 Tax=Oreochromis niloticus TaxID=8128 RepID=UPI0009055BA5|nr:programmed cell death 1 ligand 1-like [Oreochromis niloticus]